MMGFGPGMMGGGFSIILWIIIIGVVYYFFKEYNRHNHQNHNDRRNGGSRYKGQSNFEKHREKFNHKRELESSNNGDSAEQIARERYANGEITKEELNEIMDNLNNHNKNINP